MSDAKRDESTELLSKGPRQQYHYLYGSSTTLDRYDNFSLGTATDQDSLVGEALVPTDNEQEDLPNHANEGDLQQLLMTNGKDVRVLGVNGYHSRPSGFRIRAAQALQCLHLRRTQPLLYIITLAGTAGLFCLILGVFYLSATATRKKAELPFNMPFQRVDRGDFGDPVSNFLDKSLFDPSLVNRRGRKEFIFPFPTGSFWTNLVLPPTADRGFSYPVVVYPYAYAWSPAMLQVSYPFSHRVEEPKMIHDYFFPDITMGTQEGTLNRRVTSFDALSVSLKYTTQNGNWQSYLVQGSPYITIRYENTSPEIHAFSSFANVGCSSERLSKQQSGKSRRRLSDDGFGVCEWQDDSTKTHRILRGVQFRISSQEGMEWIVFSSEPIELLYDLIERSKISSIKKFRGVLRLAYVPSREGEYSAVPRSKTSASAASTNVTESTGLQRLIYHAGVYPVGGEVGWTFRSSDTQSGPASGAKSVLGKSVTAAFSSTISVASNRIGTVTFQFATESFAPPNTASTAKPLLMLALPHHAEMLPSSMQLGRDQFDLTYRCIKGPMRPVVGRTWAYDESLPPIDFDDFDPSDKERKGYLDLRVRSTILESLKTDVTLAPPTASENVYGYGKQTARLAQVAHIARMLQGGNQTSTSDKDLVDQDEDIAEVYQQAVKSLRYSLERFLNSSISDALVFDENLGGLVSTDGLRDSASDFGNGRYNDHHFHYGYLLYSCAVMGSIDRGFVVDYSDAIDAIYYDIAHDENFKAEKSHQVFFPGARHKIWFDGHSFASGLFPFGNGKSQESSSEAVNGYFGAYLWSRVKHETMQTPGAVASDQTDFARLLLATEVRGAQTYWHMVPPSDDSSTASATVYSPEFSKNYMVGNLGMLDAIFSTWFGTASLYVHMINLLPVTAVTATLFNAGYVQKQYTAVISTLGLVEMAWRGYIVCNHALIDPLGAWKEAQDLESGELDSGISKSQVLYWIATRKGFVSKLPEVEKLPPKALPINADARSCSYHKQCRVSGIMGLCCPTTEGVSLECCTK